MRLSRLLVIISLLVVLAFVGALAASADDLQPWMVAAASQGWGGSTPAQVQTEFRNFRNAQAEKFQYTTPALWELTYNIDAGMFLRAHGCSSCSLEGGQLSFALKVSLPVGVIDFIDILPVQFRTLAK